MSDMHARVQARLKGAPLSQNTYAIRKGLAKLPALVRRQRRLERQLARVEDLQKREKACRDAIDGLLVKAGLKSGEGMTCLGYDLVHNERRGRTSINADKLRGAGVAECDIQFATETGAPSSFATVRPMKGSAVHA